MSIGFYIMFGVVGLAVVIVIILERIDYRQEFWTPTQKQLDQERLIMELEKEYFGHYSNYYERQTKEYQKWL